MKINKYKDASSIWLTYKGGLKYYILKKVRDEEIANELSSAVLMKVYHSCCSDIEIKNMKSWLYQIANNVVFDYFKKTDKTSPNLPEIIAETDEPSAYEEAAGFIEPLIQLLPPKYREVLRMSDIMDMKQVEIAAELNLSLTATKSRVQRARKLLKKKIIECCDIETSKNGNLVSFEVKRHCSPLHSCKNGKTR